MTCVSRQSTAPAAGAVLHRVTGYDDEAGLARAFNGIDAVFHLAARAHVLAAAPGSDENAAFRMANVDSARVAACAARAAACKRFVLVSSIGVNGDRTEGHPFTEQDAPNPQQAYARSKRDAELVVTQVLSGSATELVVVRPTLVYGPNCPGNFRTLVRLVRRLPLVPLGGLHRRRSFIGVQNLCTALITAAKHRACGGRTFLLCDGEDIDVATLVRLILAGLGFGSGRLLTLPEGLLRATATLVGRRAAFDKLADELRVDGQAFRTTTGWRPGVTVADGVVAAAQSFAGPALR